MSSVDDRFPSTLTLHAVAERLHVTRRWLQEYLRQNPYDQFGRPVFRVAGRSKIFTEDDYNRLLETLPTPQPRVPLNVRRIRRHQSVVRDATLEEALRLCQVKKRRS